MKASEVREKYLKFFESKGHKRISPSPVIPENDPTTLFTSSGMQQLVPYLMGEPHPLGKRLTDSQPLFRAHGANSDDVEEVGDNRHLTFFEMLGNWSLGDYFKKEQLSWLFEFLTSKDEGLGLDPSKLYISVFEGNEFIGKDDESIEIWKSIFSKAGIKAEEGERIFTYPAKKNWWSRSGTPDEMPVGEIGGPDSEVFLDFGEDLRLHEKSSWKKEKCHPNCDCGRFMEIGNSVFMQYKKVDDGKLEELPNKNVDFGGGLERLTAAANSDPDVFKIDIFWPTIEKVQEVTGKSYEGNEKPMRIIADHMRAANFLASEGIIPSNKLQGYVLRRLIRRAALKMRNLKSDFSADDFAGISKEKSVLEEVERFKKTIEGGLKEASKIEEINGKKAFDLYQTYGFPLELTIEIFSEKGQEIDREEFKKEFEKHKEKSRTASAGMFKGGLADHSVETTKLHTATHLLHKSLRKVLGEHVSQKGSNITVERLRFDFSHDKKMTDGEIKKVEDMMNEQIGKALPVSFEIMTLDEARKSGALAFFGEKYGDKVKVYTIGDPDGDWFSKEVCGGPHVENTSELGHVRIIKEEAAGAGIRRIYAKLA